MHITLGVDGHKESHTVVAINQVGQFLDQITIANDPHGFQGAYRWACDLGPDRTWGIENSGHFAWAFAQYLLSQGEALFEVSPHLTGRKRNRSHDAPKSDPNDALAVARIVLQDGDKLHPVKQEDETTKVKLLVEQRGNLVSERTRLLNQLHAHLTDIEPHYKKEISKLNQVEVLNRYKTYTLEGASSIQKIRITLIRQLAGLIVHFNQQIQALEKLIKPIVLVIAPALVSIEGIAEITAAQLVARVGNIDHVPSAASLAHYGGLAPIQCGTAENYYDIVNSKGDRQLNAIFHRIAATQARQNPLAKAYLAKKKAEGKTPKHAFRCLKRRMVDVVYAVWKSGQAYQPPVAKAAA